MAQRRMFSPKVTSTDQFLDMSVSARELYFQLGMNADDDGFITPKRIMRMINSSDDDLKMLIMKGFVIPFKSGVIVISAWKVNNLIRKDWHQETIYQEEKKQLTTNEKGEYQLVNEMLTDCSHSIVKYSVVKDNCVPKETLQELTSVNEEVEYVNEYQKEGLKEHQDRKQSTDDFLMYYDAQYREKIHDKGYIYSPRSPKLRKLVQTGAVKVGGFERLKELLDLYFDRDDKFTKERVYGIEFFLNNQTLNELDKL